MIHSGAIVGGCLATFRLPGCDCTDSVFHYFREDHEKRDFVAGGSAAGVAAAFGAPVGQLTIYHFTHRGFSISKKVVLKLTSVYFIFFMIKTVNDTL